MLLAHAIMARIVGVGGDPGRGVGDLVEADHPGPGRGGGVDPLLGLGVGAGCLQRCPVDAGMPQQRLVNAVQLRRKGMHDDRMVVGIERLQAVGKGLALGVRVGVFLAQVPGHPEMVPEAGDQFAIIQGALDAESAAVEQLVVLGLLGDDVHRHAFAVHVVENDFPLGELADIVARPLGRVRPGRHVVAVAVHVHGEEVQAVHALFGQVVDRADDAGALAAVPGGIAGIPVPDMGHIGMGGLGVVEAAIGQEIFRTVGAALQVPLAGLGEAQMMVPDIGQQALAAEIHARLVGLGNREAAGAAVEIAGRRAGTRIGRSRDIAAGAERRRIGPGAGLVRCEMGAPDIAGVGMGLGRLSVGGVVARYDDRLARFGMAEGDVQPIIGERIDGRGLACLRAGEVERSLVPRLQLTGNDSGRWRSHCKNL